MWLSPARLFLGLARADTAHLCKLGVGKVLIENYVSGAVVFAVKTRPSLWKGQPSLSIGIVLHRFLKFTYLGTMQHREVMIMTNLRSFLLPMYASACGQAPTHIPATKLPPELSTAGKA